VFCSNCLLAIPCHFKGDDGVDLAAVHEGIDDLPGAPRQAEDDIYAPFFVGIEHGIGEISPVVDHHIPGAQGLQVRLCHAALIAV
jgi:hypothetical protein